MAREMNIGTPPDESDQPAFDFTNVFGNRGRTASVGAGEGRATSRRRVREGSVPGEGGATASQNPPTVEERVFAMLRALESQGQTTTSALTAVMSRLDSVESRLSQGSASGGGCAAQSDPAPATASAGQAPLSPPRAGHGQGVSSQDPIYQTPPGLQQAAAGQPAWDPCGSAFPGNMFPGGGPSLIPPPPPPYQGFVPPWVGLQGPSQQQPQGQDDGSGKNIDVKWIPQVPECKWSTWKTRRDEIQGFWSWIEALCSWLGLLQPLYVPEMKEVLERDVSLTSDLLSPQQMSRSSRLFYLLKSAFAGNKRVESIIRIFELQQNVGETNGYELVRLFRREFSVKSRTEALQFRQEFLDLKISKSESPVEIMRTIEARYLQFRQLLMSCPYPRMITDVDIPESDIYLLILRSMPSSVEQYLRYHCGETVMDLKKGIEFIQSRQLITGDLSRASVLKED